MNPLYLVLALQLADVASTFAAFRVGLVEANPVLVALGKILGIRTAIVAAKAALAAGLIAAEVAGLLAGQETVLWTGSAVYAAIVARNLYLIRKKTQA